MFQSWPSKRWRLPSAPMRWRLTLSATAIVAIVVTAMTMTCYFLVRQTLLNEVDAMAAHEASDVLSRGTASKDGAASSATAVIPPSAQSGSAGAQASGSQAAGTASPEPSHAGNAAAPTATAIAPAPSPGSQGAGAARTSTPATSPASPEQPADPGVLDSVLPGVPADPPHRFMSQFDVQSQIYLSSTASPLVTDGARPFPIGSAERDVIDGQRQQSLRTAWGYRYYAVRNSEGQAVVVRASLASTERILSQLGLGLIFVGFFGVVCAFGCGLLVFRAGISPLKRFQKNVEHVANHDDLTPIEVSGNDEISELATSFNKMLDALSKSRQQQAELVSDAGHELKTPLTSLRTNIELLMMISRSSGSETPAGISDQERQNLENDVMAQIEELTSLVGDLVDLARQDDHTSTEQPVELEEVVEVALERARRRRPDITFDAQLCPWWVMGDAFALGRAVMNVLDNAAKWSPKDSTVFVSMKQCGDEESGTCELTVEDSGPGIPEADREKVFDRFYRSISSRSMPGSGLGLAIVKKVIDEHGGSICALEGRSGGALIRIVIPGALTHSELPASS